MADILTAIAQEATEKTNIRLIGRNVEKVLASLQITSDFWKVVDYSDLPVPAASEIVRGLIDEGLVKVENNEVLLTEKLFLLSLSCNLFILLPGRQGCRISIFFNKKGLD